MSDPFLDHPEGWVVTTLSPNKELGFIESVDSGGTPSTANDDFWDGDIPWLTPKEISRSSGELYVSKTERNISIEGLQRSSAKLLPAGTVMLCKRAPVGPVAVAAIPMATNQGFLNFQCGPKLLPAYLAYWLIANERYLLAVANGSTYPELYKGDLFEFEIAVPPIEIQQKILKVIAAAKQLALCLDAKTHSVIDISDVTKLQSLRLKIENFYYSLLPIVMSGRLVDRFTL